MKTNEKSFSGPFHKFLQDENSVFNRVLLNFELRKYYLHLYLQGALKSY